MNIYVSSLSYNTTDDDLKQLFTAYGDVTSAKVIMDKFTNRSKGFGFVEISGQEAGEKAIKELNGKHVDGRAIGVTEARPREERPATKRSFTNNRW